MRQFEWRWLYGSVWVSALHIPVGVGHRWIHGASTLSCVKWHPVVSQGTTPSTTSFHVRLPQPKFQSRRNLLVFFILTANTLMVWRWHPGKEVCLSSHMGCYSRYHAGRLRHFGLCILSWRRSWDGGVQKTSQVRRIVRVVLVPADWFGNFAPNQQIRCVMLKRFGPQNHFCLCRR